MIDITTRTCEQTSGRSGRSSCYTKSKAVFAESYYDYETKLNVPTITLACGVHAAGIRRRSWAPEELDVFDDKTQQMLTNRDERAAAAAERQAKVDAEKSTIREQQRLERAVEAWDASKVEWTTTMTVDVERDPWSREGANRIEVQVHVHAVGTEINGWDHCEVSIVETADAPAVVKIQGGSPMTISTKAALALSSAIAIVSQFVDEINA